MTKDPISNRFIRDDDDAEQTPDTAGPTTQRRMKATETRRPRPSGGAGPYVGRRQVTAHIPRQLFMGLKAISAQTEKPMVEIFEEALQAYASSWMAQKKY